MIRDTRLILGFSEPASGFAFKASGYVHRIAVKGIEEFSPIKEATRRGNETSNFHGKARLVESAGYMSLLILFSGLLPANGSS